MAYPRYNPRYVAYAEAHGRTPSQQTKHDRTETDGGTMAQYIVWMHTRWTEWDTLTGHDGGYHSKADNAEFDAWLTS